MSPRLPHAHFFLCLFLAHLLTSCGRQTTPLVVEAGTGVAYLAADEITTHDVMRRLVLTRMLGSEPGIRLSLSNAEGDAVLQAQQVYEALARQVKYLILNPVDAVILTPAVQQARKSGAIVIGIGETARGMPCDAVLWCDSRELGRQAGTVALRALQRRAKDEGSPIVQGRVLQIRGSEDSAACANRSEGFLQALSAEPGIILVHDAPGFWKRDEGSRRAEEALRIQKCIDVVYAHDDVMAHGATLALGESRESTLVIGTDGLGSKNGGLILLNEGLLDATIYQPLLVDFAAILITKDMAEPGFQPKPEYELQPRTVTPRDLDDIRLHGMMPYPDL